MAQPTDGAEFQTALARLLVEPELTERFHADPDGTARELGLDDTQIAALKSAGVDRLRSFARGLAGKRFQIQKRVCQVTYRLLELYGLEAKIMVRFVRENPPLESTEFPTRSIRDGVWLTEMLQRMVAAGELDAPYLEDVARFERQMLAVTSFYDTVNSAVEFQKAYEAWPEPTPEEMLAAMPRRGIHAAVESFSCDVTQIVRQLAADGDLPELEPQPTHLLFSKVPGWRNVRYARINDLTRELLELCDGTRSTREIVARLVRQGHLERDPEQLTPSCLEILSRFYQLLTITFDRPV